MMHKADFTIILKSLKKKKHLNIFNGEKYPREDYTLRQDIDSKKIFERKYLQ